MKDLDLDLLSSAPPGSPTVVARNRWAAHRRATAGAATTEAGLRRRLAAGGRGGGDVFAVFPHADGPLAVLPLDTPGPVDFYYRTRILPGLSLLPRLGIGAAVELGLARHLVPAFVAVGGFAHANAAGESELAAHLCREWPRLVPGSAVPQRVHLARLRTRPGARSTVTLLVFADDRDAPELVLKVNRDPGYPDSVEREFAGFSAVHARVRACGAGIPRPVFLERVGRHVVFGQTALPGRPFPARAFQRSERVRSRLVAPLVDRAFDWLTAFHVETSSGTWTLDARFIDERCRAVFDAVVARYPEAGAWREELRGIERRLAKFEGALLPRGAVHGDFTHANLLFDDQRVSVVDWEDCEPDGFPLTDVFFLVCQLALSYHGEETTGTASFRRFLGGEGPVRKRVVDGLHAYAARLGFDPRLVGLLLPSFLGGLLVKEYPEHRARATYGFATLDCLRASMELGGRLA